MLTTVQHSTLRSQACSPSPQQIAVSTGSELTSSYFCAFAISGWRCGQPYDRDRGAGGSHSG